jgi:protein PsiE|tara:strand:+ start:198 stop:521 length:324 start_codon:yes stop_codon:yes gene_type:complete
MVLFLFGREIYIMTTTLDVTVNRILNFFIYLEIMQMVSIFFQTGRIPVRYPLYISMIGLARYISLENLDGREAIFITGSIFLISLALVGLAYRTKIVRSTPKQEDEE